MTLRAMEVFLAVVETGSMRAAADRLYISQPSVSGVIAELEAEYNARLFERLGKKLYITPEGRCLAALARRMLSLREEIGRQMGGQAEPSPLRIGATVTVGTCVLGDILRRMDGPSPRVLINNTRLIEQELLRSNLDAALVEGDIHSPELKRTPVIRDTLCLICRTDDERAQKQSIPLSSLAGEPLLMRETGSGTRLTLDRVFAEKGVPMCIAWECNNTQAILNAVEQGFGVSLLSPLLLRGQSRLCAVPVADADLSRWFSYVVHKDKFISPPLQAFFELCRTFC